MAWKPPQQSTDTREVSANGGPGSEVDFGDTDLGKRQHAADVVARRELRHHAAVVLMHVDLAVQRLGPERGPILATRLHRRHAGLVAARFDTQDVHCRDRHPDSTRNTDSSGLRGGI